MIWNKQFKYPNSQRSIKGEYDISKMLLPSVTTVLNATQPEDKRKSLDKWARRVGEDEATRIKELAGRRGTAMHFYLQKHLDPDCKGYMDLTTLGQVAEPMAKKIIEKYKDNELLKEKELVLPVLSNQKMNAYIKEIATLAGITKNLTFHLARHTFATTVTLTNGVPIESVSKMLGHTNLKTTQHYAKILDMKVSRDMSILRDKFKSKI